MYLYKGKHNETGKEIKAQKEENKIQKIKIYLSRIFYEIFTNIL